MLDRAFWIPSFSLFGFSLRPFVLSTPAPVVLTGRLLERALGLGVRAIGETPVAAVTAFAGAIPYPFVGMIPYLATLAVVTLAMGKARFPAALGPAVPR